MGKYKVRVEESEWITVLTGKGSYNTYEELFWNFPEESFISDLFTLPGATHRIIEVEDPSYIEQSAYDIFDGHMITNGGGSFIWVPWPAKSGAPVTTFKKSDHVHRLVRNFVCGKEFYYCRDCKNEVTLNYWQNMRMKQMYPNYNQEFEWKEI